MGKQRTARCEIPPLPPLLKGGEGEFASFEGYEIVM